MVDENNEVQWDDWTVWVFDEVPYDENVRRLEGIFPDVHFRDPKEAEKARKRPLLSYRSSDGTSLYVDTEVVVKPHNPQGHPYEYEYGRIQMTVPKELVGITAKVHFEFPNAPKIETKRRRGRKGPNYFDIG